MISANPELREWKRKAGEILEAKGFSDALTYPADDLAWLDDFNDGDSPAQLAARLMGSDPQVHMYAEIVLLLRDIRKSLDRSP
jgi:hypothetical protein